MQLVSCTFTQSFPREKCRTVPPFGPRAFSRVRLLTEQLVLHRTPQGLVPEAEEAVGFLLDPVLGGIAEGCPVHRGHFLVVPVAQQVQKLEQFVLSQPAV